MKMVDSKRPGKQSSSQKKACRTLNTPTAYERAYRRARYAADLATMRAAFAGDFPLHSRGLSAEKILPVSVRLNSA